MKKILLKNMLPLKVLVMVLCCSFELSAQQMVFFNSPAAGTSWNRGQTYPITWTFDENAQPIMRLRISHTIDGITSYTVIQDSVIINSGATQYTVPVEATPNLDYTIQAVSSDTAEVLFGESAVFTINETIVGTQEMPENVNADFRTFPNPFCGSTTICYSLPESSRASIELFDVNGKQVSVLKNEMQLAGQHQFNFDAAHLPRGIYLLKLQTNKTVSTLRIAVQ